MIDKISSKYNKSDMSLKELAESYYEICPICKKKNTCYKVGTRVFCKKGNHISKVLTNAFNKAINN